MTVQTCSPPLLLCSSFRGNICRESRFASRRLMTMSILLFCFSLLVWCIFFLRFRRNVHQFHQLAPGLVQKGIRPCRWFGTLLADLLSLFSACSSYCSGRGGLLFRLHFAVSFWLFLLFLFFCVFLFFFFPSPCFVSWMPSF